MQYLKEKSNFASKGVHYLIVRVCAQNNYRVSNVPIYNGDIIEYDKKEDVTENKYSKAIASRITSYARCVLIKAINKDPTRFIYCDTDSIYIKGDYEYNIPVDDKIGRAHV